MKMKDFNRKKRKGGCLDFRWKGPYIITASLGKGLYRLREQNGEKVYNILLHLLLSVAAVLVFNFNITIS